MKRSKRRNRFRTKAEYQKFVAYVQKIATQLSVGGSVTVIIRSMTDKNKKPNRFKVNAKIHSPDSSDTEVDG